MGEEDDKVLQVGYSDDYTMWIYLMWIYLMPLNCTLKNGKCFMYFTTIKMWEGIYGESDMNSFLKKIILPLESILTYKNLRI